MHHLDSPESSRIKLILLALVDRQPGISAETLCALAQDSLFFDYFSVAAALSDLQAKGLISSGERRGQTPGLPLSCQLSAEGLAVLRRLESRLPDSVHKTLDKLEQKKRDKEAASTSLEALADGDWLLHLRAFSENETLMALKLRLPSEKMARRLAEVWPERAGKIYQLILAQLDPGT